MTEQKFEDLPIANKNKIVIIRQVDDKWRIGYVLDGQLYVHQFFHSGTFNSVRAKVKEYINDGCVIGDFNTGLRWFPVENVPELFKNMFSYVTALQVTPQDIHQFEIIERIKAQEVSTREPDEVYGKPSPAHPVLSKADDEIMSDIIAGIHLKPMVIEITEKGVVEEPEKEVVGENSGSHCDYYQIVVNDPQNPRQTVPYVANTEDLIQSLQMTFDEACEFKSLVRRANARLGFAKAESTPVRDATKAVHYAKRVLRFEQRKAGLPYE